jgi:hypothetical protein
MAKRGPSPKSKKQKVDESVASFGARVFQADSTKDGWKLFCKLCCRHVNCNDSNRVSQHVMRAGHQKKLEALNATVTDLTADNDEPVAKSKMRSEGTQVVCNSAERVGGTAWRVRFHGARNRCVQVRSYS